MKANHPLEFTVANLRHSKDDDSALKILRDAVENDGVEYIPMDSDNSEIDWTINNGLVVGGLKNMIGFGQKKAEEIMLCRAGKKKWTPAKMKALLNPVTPFDTLYPCYDLWKDVYENYTEYGLKMAPDYIKDTNINRDSYLFIGKVVKKDPIDLNNYTRVAMRDGKILKTHTKMMKVTIEDDTGQMNTVVDRYAYDKIDVDGFVEKLVAGKSWVIVRGEVDHTYRYVRVTHMFNLDDLEDEE
jgi:DNA polymerase III alpha subunit